MEEEKIMEAASPLVEKAFVSSGLVDVEVGTRSEATRRSGRMWCPGE
jgi:hypothetical protein